MSSYDDPRWYEQQPVQNESNEVSSQPPAYSEVDSLPRYQMSDNGMVTRQKMGPYPPQFIPKAGRRRLRGFGRSVLLVALLLIAFVGGWLANQAYSNSFNPGNQSQSYSNLIQDRKSTRLNSSHLGISYAVFCLKKKNKVFATS